MAQAKGSAARFAFINETTWGTTPGSPAMKQLAAAVYGESLGGTQGEIESNAIRSQRGRKAIRGGEFNVAGSVPFELAPLGMASILKNALGANVTTGAGPFVHTIKRGQTIIPMSIEKAFTDLAQYFVFAGCMVDKLSMNMSPENSLVTGSLDIQGKQFAASGTQLGVPTAPVHTPFADFEAAFLEGGGAATVLNFGLSFTNDLERVAALGTKYAAALNEGTGTADVSLTMMFDTMSAVNKWINETQSSVQVTLTQGANSMLFLLPALKYVGDTIPKIATPQGIIVELTGKAIYDTTEATDLKVVVTNTETTI